MKINEIRFLISINLLLIFSIVSVTGVVMLFDEKIKHVFPLLKELHIIGGVVMIVLVIIHLILNWKMLVGESKLFFK